MSAWDEVHIKQKIEITGNVLNETHSFGSIIVRKNDTSVFYSMPSSQHAPKAMKKGAPLKVMIHTDRKYVQFETEVDTIQPGTPPVIKVNRPEEAGFIIRPKCGQSGMMENIPVIYRLMKDAVTPISDPKKGNTIFIGSGDSIILAFQKLPPGNFIELTYSIDPSNPTSLVGKIEDCVEVKVGAQSQYECFIRYEAIRPGDQDKIVKHIFEKTMSMRRRGMY